MKRRIDAAQILMIPGGFSAGDEPAGSGKFIAAVFRRMKKKQPVLQVGNIVMDCDRMTVTVDDKEISLSGKEFKLLQYALENPGKVLTRDELLTNVWGYEGGETRTIDNYVSHLRKLGFNFETVFGVGYKFKA